MRMLQIACFWNLYANDCVYIIDEAKNNNTFWQNQKTFPTNNENISNQKYFNQKRNR